MTESLLGLHTVLLLDQIDGWQRGVRPTIESYLERVPELGSDRKRLMDLIYQEVVLRSSAGESPTEEEYAIRFPRMTRELRLQFEVHSSLGGTTLEGEQAGSELEPQFEGYRIDGELGRGAFGTVYKAWEPALRRFVAIKLLADSNSIWKVSDNEQFTEAQSIARLNHPNIVQIHSVNRSNHGVYFAQELVEGGTLARFTQSQSQDPRESAALVACLASAIHYAHLCHVVHCDLKPANVLLRPTLPLIQEKPRRLSDFNPMISDFGLSRHLDMESAVQSKHFSGTLHYMAPEQTGIEGAMIGATADIYSLGAILYELLTGRPPFVDESKLTTFLKVRNEAPARPRDLLSSIPRDLEAICLKCLEKKSVDRYASAAELANDLYCWLQGNTVQARPGSRMERVAKWCRRQPALASFIGLLVIASSGTIAGLQWHHFRLADEAKRANANYESARQTIRQMLLAAETSSSMDIPKVAELRLKLLNSALPYFERPESQKTEQQVVERVVLLLNVGFLEVQLGKLVEAENHFTQAEQMSKNQVDQTIDVELRRADCSNKLAAIQLARGKTQLAIGRYQQSLDTLKSLADRNVAVPQLNAATAQTRLNLGICFEKLGNFEQAEVEYRSATELRRRLVSMQPSDDLAKLALGETLSNLAQRLLHSNSAEAERTFEEAFQCLIGVKDSSLHLQAQVSAAANEINWGNWFGGQGDTTSAKEKYRSAINRLKEVLATEPAWRQASQHLYAALGALANLETAVGEYDAALQNWNHAIAIAGDSQQRDYCRQLRLVALAKTGNHRYFYSELQSLNAAEAISNVDRYNHACCLAIASVHAANESGDEAKDLTELYQKHAISLLTELNQIGFFEQPAYAELLSTDADLVALRARSEFKNTLKLKQ